ncbi:hypothetical protein GCM10010321_36750 [Streptomyces chartreusis]|nr:hypothetical protein GCM10010321_36750 [Streptomyces chartreusis]
MNAVAVIPTSSPGGACGSSGSSGGSSAVTSTTPAANRDIAARNSSSLTPSACPKGLREAGRTAVTGGAGREVFGTPETLMSVPHAPHRACARERT